MIHGYRMTGERDEPEPWAVVGLGHSRYKGRDFYGPNADEIAELNYLRDWKEWAMKKIKFLQVMKP